VLEEVLVIAAGLTIQDPRERPSEHQQAADTAHARFADENSDFLALLNLWRYVTEQQEALSGSQFRRTLKREFLHYLRIREWQDLYGQLRSTARRLGMATGELATEPDERGVHTALLAGLLSHVGLQVEETKGLTGGAAAGSTSAPATRASFSPPAPRWRRSRRAGWSPPSWWRPAGCSPAPSRASTPRSSSGWPATW
jgi:ATP-dependent helicase HrpA